MNCDHHFEIGNSHRICEDYALSGQTKEVTYVILSDGCSSGIDVDVGARLVALSARRTLFENGFEMSYDTFGKVTLFNLDKISSYLSLHPLALDATLLVTWIRNNKFTTYIYGD